MKKKTGKKKRRLILKNIKSKIVLKRKPKSRGSPFLENGKN